MRTEIPLDEARIETAITNNELSIDRKLEELLELMDENARLRMSVDGPMRRRGFGMDESMLNEHLAFVETLSAVKAHITEFGGGVDIEQSALIDVITSHVNG